MCSGVAELSEALDLDVRAIQVRTLSEIFCFYFYSSRRIKLFLFVRNSVEYNFIIRREHKPEDLFRAEVATNLQLNRKFWPLFII